MSCIRVLCIFSVGFCILSCGKNLKVGKNNLKVGKNNLKVGKNNLKDAAKNEISDNILIPKEDTSRTNTDDSTTVTVKPPKTVQEEAKEAFTEFVGAFQNSYQKGCIFSQNPSTIKGGTEKTVNGKKVITVNGDSGSFTITLKGGNSWNEPYRQVAYNYQNYTSRGLILNNITNWKLFNIHFAGNSNEFEIKGGAGIAISGIFNATLTPPNTDLVGTKDCKTLEYNHPLTFTYKHKDGKEVLKISKSENPELFKMFLNKA